MNEDFKALDINSAELVELTNLPGIGLNTAEKIVASRPFTTIDELREISGIGEVVFERIAPFIYVTTIQLDTGEKGEVPVTSETPVAEEANSPDQDVASEGNDQAASQIFTSVVTPEEPSSGPPAEPIQELPAQQSRPASTSLEDLSEANAEAEIETEPASSIAIEPSTPVLEQSTPVRAKNRNTPGPARTAPPTPATVFGSFLDLQGFSILFSVAISLGILFLLNNSLQYTKPSDLDRTEQKLSDVSSQASSLARDIETLTTRLDNLESIAGRVSAVEKGMEETRNEIETLSSGIEALNRQIDELDQRVDELQKTTSQFSTFLEGLKEL
jgi:competence ComEA-like helix-hairpin-helix protein